MEDGFALEQLLFFLSLRKDSGCPPFFGHRFLNKPSILWWGTLYDAGTAKKCQECQQRCEVTLDGECVSKIDDDES